MPDWVTPVTTIVAALIAAVVAVRAAGHRERRAVKEEAEILAALPTYLDSAKLLREVLDQRLRGYVLHQTSVGRQVMIVGGWFWGYFVLATGAAAYFGSDYLLDLGQVALWVGFVLIVIGYAFWLLERRSVYGLRRAGMESISDFGRAVRDLWHDMGERSRRAQ
jgi:hypothetical protein